MSELLKVCKNCWDYSAEAKVCLIRYSTNKDKSRTPMKRQPNQTGCDGFMYPPTTKQE